MPWIHAKLRGQLVYARASASGELAVEGGRVEIRYKPNDGRLYHARADNLVVTSRELLPDETCGPAEATKSAKSKDGAPAAGSKTGAAGKSAASTTSSAKASAKPPEKAEEGGTIIAYADGACSGNPGPAGLGIVLLDGERRVEISTYLGQGTNNIAELTAILDALAEVKDVDRPMVLHTDSQYSIGVLQKGWKAKANTELVASVKRALAEHGRTKLVYVPGHAGVSLNERADQLARMAVQTRRSSRKEYPAKPKT